MKRYKIEFRTNKAWMQKLDQAAKKKNLNLSEYARRSIEKQLKADGFGSDGVDPGKPQGKK